MNTKETTQKSDVALREEAILQFWNEHDIFNKSLTKEAPQGDFVFYDGPPFATGLPHHGHILAGTIKDAIPRFWTMNGFRVRRKWGWDCHGLPLENLIEKKLGLATKRDIEEYGVKNFNEAARGAVMEYADDWRKIIPRMGRFADMDNDYKTMDSTYTESVWWVFSQLHEKGLVYEGFKSMHLCPRCGTTLSNFEVNQGYKDIKDIAVFVELPLIDEPNTSLLVWTTTPWTLPGNMAAAVHNDYDYVVVEKKDEGEGDLVRFIVAKDRLSAVFGEDDYEVVKTIKGSELVGKSYVPPFDYYADQELENKDNAWKIYHADYVELGEEGTGAVHLAPAYGDDDMKLAQEYDVPIVHHVDEVGHFKDFVTDFAGQLVKPKDDDESGVMHLDADIEIVKALQANGRLFKKENITHSYPHCWRCDTPLLNYATTSWFVEVTKMKDQLVAENDKVKWVPEHVGKNRFGRWLEGARDWAVSRQRYWGAPLPIWRNPETKEYKVFGSLSDLQDHTPKSGNKYYMMRHGQAEHNVADIVSSDPTTQHNLTELGKDQVAAAILELKDKNIDLVYVSPLVRTKETAALVSAALGLNEDQVIVEDRLSENLGGILEGKPVDEWREFRGSLKSGEQMSGAYEGGESWSNIKKRMVSVLFDLEEQHKDKNILFISHGSPLRLMQWGALCIPDRQIIERYENEGDPETGSVHPVNFAPFPHNDNYELDYHRPYIDDYEVVDESGTKLERVLDVFDCWFESGSMPYGQHHYPFENSENFEKEYYPAQFIAEGLDQTRGWFYSLIVLGTALFGKSPYQNVIVNGLVMAEDGKKMSKSLQNYPDPMDIADTVGVDAMRFYLLSSPLMRSEDLNFVESGVLELQRKNIGRLHNVLTMYEMFADDTKAQKDSANVLDRWIVARLNQLVAESTAGFTSYELDRATRPVTDFIDDLSVWYLRRSRDRLKGDNIADRELALGTLRYVLEQLSLVMAPSMPFYAEHLWQVVKAEGATESVHLAAWPVTCEVDTEVLETMAKTREIVTLALEQRAKVQIKVRQPLGKMFLKTETEIEQDYALIIKDEVNVKELECRTDGEEIVELDTTLTPELKAEGEVRELMRAIQGMRKDAGLEQQDRVVLTISASTEGEEIIKRYEDEIKRVVGAEEILYTQISGLKVSVGTREFMIAIEKV